MIEGEVQHVRGLADLGKMLQQFPAKIEAKILRSALRQGANVILAESKARVPVKSGALRNTLRVKTSLKRGKVTATIVAGNGKKGVYYAGFVERGTKSHIIRTRSSKTLRMGGVSAKAVFIKQVQHPGARQKPFMAPALAAKADAAIKAIAEHIKKRLAEAV